MALAADQRKVVRRIKQIGAEVGASPKEVKAALETGIVESNLRNLPGGDADSQGWRQERASLYPNPRDLDASIRRFYQETSAVKHKYGRAGDLAAAVQRPAAQYRGRYEAVSAQADALRGATPTTPRIQPGNNTATATDNSAARGAAIAQFLGRRNQDPVEFAMNIRALRDVPSSGADTSNAPAISRPVRSPAPGGGGDAAVQFGQSRLGQYQENAGSNRGGQLDSLQSKFGMKGQPWCAMFTSVAVTRGGAPKVARTASVGEVRAQVTRGGAGYEKGFKGAARPGDLWLRGNAHIGLVERVDSDGTIHTIEGNTGGGKVERRTHRPGEGDIARPLYSRQLR